MKKLLLSFFACAGVIFGMRADDAPSNIEVLLDADFTVFTEGSEENPVSLLSSTVKDKVSGIYAIYKVSAVGGKLWVDPSGYIDAAQFESLPSTGTGGTIRVQAEVKMLDSYGGGVQIKRGYTSDTSEILVEDDEWTTVTTMVPGFTNSSTSRMRILPFLSVSGFYIKSLKVEYSPNFVAAPEAYLPSDADGTQFTAQCSRVGGAAKYEADVFTLDGDQPEYVQQNVELKALSTYSLPQAKITGLDPEKTYYYVARAINENGDKSDDSEVVKVIIKKSSIEAPEALAASNVTETGFTANWDAVADAEYYIVGTYVSETIAEATTANVFEEDFSGVNVGSLSSVEFSGDINSFTKQPGWEADFNSKAYAAGYYVFSMYGGSGYLITPEIDLSGADGHFEVTINAATGAFGYFNATQNTLTVEIIKEENGETVVVETAPVLTCDKTDFTNFVFPFTKGTEATRLRITYTQTGDDTNKLFIDDIAISQVLAAGSIITKQLASAESEATSLEIALTPESGKEYSYDVIAVGETVVGAGSSAAIGTIQSNRSNRVVVDFAAAGIDEISAESEAKAWKAGDGILGVNGSDVAVHDLLGRTLLHKTLPAGTHSLRVNVRGLVIVTVDGKSYKIVL